MAQAIDLTLDLPPLLTGFPVVPPVRAVDAARTAFLEEKAGAGDVFWSCDTDIVSVAFLLEPEVPADRAHEMLFALMVATGEAVGATCPPELALTWNWPRRFLANGAHLGNASFHVSDQLDDGGVPDWLIVAVDLRLKPYEGPEPGQSPDRTSLWDEGAVELEAPELISALSRYFLSWINRWEGEGFKPVHDAWLFRCTGRAEEVQLLSADGVQLGAGRLLGLDEGGNLLLKSEGLTQSFALDGHLDATAKPLAALGEKQGS